MKFGKTLKELRLKEWEEHYVDYRMLKKALRNIVECQLEGRITEVTRGTASLFRFLEMEIFNANRFFLLTSQRFFDESHDNTSRALALITAAMKCEDQSVTDFPEIGESKAVLSAVVRRAFEIKSLQQFSLLCREATRKIVKKYDKNLDTEYGAQVQSLLAERGYFKSDQLDRLQRYYDGLLALVGSVSTGLQQQIDELSGETKKEHPTYVPEKATEEPEEAEEEVPWYKPTKSRVVIGVIITLMGIWGMVVGLALRPDALGVLVHLGYPVAFVLAFSNGANGAANSMGTSVGAKALTLRQAIMLCAIFELLGAMTMGQFVSKTISKGVLVPSVFSADASLFALDMFCILTGAAIITLVATIYGYPVSATHGVVGGLIAVGLASGGTEAIDTAGITQTVVAWCASPLAGLLTAALLYWVIHAGVISAKNPKTRSFRTQPALVVLTVFVSASALVIRGPEAIKITPTWAAVLAALGIGVGVAALVELGKLLRRRYRNSGSFSVPPMEDDAVAPQHMQSMTANRGAVHWSQEWREDAQGNRQLVVLDQPPAAKATALETHMANVPIVSWSTSFGATLPPAEHTARRSFETHIDNYSDWHKETAVDDDLAHRLHVEETVETQLRSQLLEDAERPFVPLLICSALSVAFAHGGNDVGNAVGPLAVIVQIANSTDSINATPDIGIGLLALGACGFVVGILILGSRTIDTVGSKITVLTPSKSFATQIGAAVAVLVCSALGLPVSTSHCLVGAVVGVGIAQKIRGMKNKINMAVLKKIFVGWVATIPLAMTVAIILYVAAQPPNKARLNVIGLHSQALPPS